MSDCFVYLIHGPADLCGRAMIKVGISSSPASRLALFKTASPFPLELAEVWRLPDRDTALRVERRVHRAMCRAHSHGEWFRSVAVGIACEIDQACCEEWAGRGHSYADVKALAVFAGVNPAAFDDIMVNAEVPATCR